MSDTEDEQVLLDDNSSDSEERGDLRASLGSVKTYKERLSLTKKSCPELVLLNTVILLANIAVLTYLMAKVLPQKELIYSPLHSVISYQIQDFVTDEDHLWTGPPNPETDSNWHNLLLGKLKV
ncbi:hypothetical protein JDV02_010704 [Purpureocillium takamizusanense]|uniref:Uncharacterized protein n=1 Tax=Purpureocillium takamizusanense TaxID=2060973 RepID=A0A9Q8VGU4_9HYPO|nr:uncharacterized protein JDV02_010704 [Purpureocillium takamizusanense]UNI24993.1 hypothetical protein JDV02_010704 [Purpureocillium takamizusanense]